MARSCTPVLTNRRRSPYYSSTPYDSLQTKCELYDKHRLSYQQGVSIELWLNYDGTWTPYTSGYTNKYGTVDLHYTCSGIPDIDFCLGYVKATVNGKAYKSNTVRFNFTFLDPEPDLIYIIDAGGCPTSPVDRSGYDIFDGYGRTDVFDRMYIGGC